MDYFLIVVLGIFVLVLWLSGRDATYELRRSIESLENEINRLREQLSAVLKAQKASQSTQVSHTESAPIAAPSVAKPPEPAPTQPAAQHTAPPAVAAYSAPPKPVVPVSTQAVQSAPPSTPAPKPSFEPIQRPPISVPAQPATHTTKPALAAEEPARDAKPFSLEETLGANWLNKLGIVILVIGLAFFLALKLQTWGPEGKVLCGYAISLLLLGGGVWLERKEQYRIFARGGIGGGWALAFFTTFAMHHLEAARILDSLAADLVLMLIVSAGMVAHSLFYRSQAVTGLAFLLGFATLLTSHVEAAENTVVFSLTASAVLALALVVVTTIRHWAVLELVGLLSVYLSHLVWLTRVLPQNHLAFAEFWPSTALILLYWLIFRLAYVLRTPLDKSEENISSISAIFNSGGVLGLLKFQSAHPEWAFWALMALGCAEMALAFWTRPKRRQAFVVLSTIATVLLVASVPFRFHGVSWPVLWLVQAQVLAICGLRLGEPVFRRLGLLAGLATGAVLAFHDVLPLALFRLDYPDPSRHGSLTLGLTLAALLYWLHAEVYPRRWPQIVENETEAFALKITSWLGLAAAASALWVIVPDLWLPVGWLALVLLLGAAARKFNAGHPSLQADALSLTAAAVLAFHHIVPLAYLRLDNPDPRPHLALTAMLSLSALAYWFYAEILPRLLPHSDPERTAAAAFVQEIASWLGTFAAAAALWVALPAAWIVPGWLILVLLLGLVADWRKAERQALQADLLACAALAGLFFWDLWTSGWWNHKAPLIAAIVLLYAGMRRKTVLAGSRNYVAPAYSWAATLLLAFAAAVISSSDWLTPVWAALGLALFEIGRFSRKGFLRWQGYLLIALGFVGYLAVDIWSSNGPAAPLALSPTGDLVELRSFSMIYSLLLNVLILASAGYWLYERTRNRDRCSLLEHAIGLTADALGTVSIALWFTYRFPSTWVPVPGGELWVTVIWAAMATLLLALAWLLRRKAFLFQAVALAVAVVLRGWSFDLFAGAPPGFWNGPLFHLSLAALILLAALPFAFQLRGPSLWTGSSIPFPEGAIALLRRPEQWFFFSSFALVVVALAVKLTSGHITIAWSLLGLGVFLFALIVGERSYRLTGLGLLLVSVAKILLMDVWALSPSDRYTTLIVLGLALLAVSFLYTRFATVIRKYL